MRHKKRFHAAKSFHLGDQIIIRLRKQLVSVVEVGLQYSTDAGVERVMHGGQVEKGPARSFVEPETGVTNGR